ncbi:MAG: hypothetical protein RXO22_01310 [Thermocladium sp.]|nr:MAG: hypothetical protein AT710_03735 [Thermocladium sp. ECH_B]
MNGNSGNNAQMKEFLLLLSKKVGYRLSRLLDIVEYAREATIIEVKEESGGVTGIRLSFKSETRDDVYHYASIGRYGAKCTCEANTLGNELCKHILAGVIIMEAINLNKYGKSLDLNEMKWLSPNAAESEIQNPGTSSKIRDGGPQHMKP